MYFMRQFMFYPNGQNFYFITVSLSTFQQEHSSKVVRLFEDVFSWLPIATVINDRVLVVHGGISEQVDLNFLQTIDRHKVTQITI